MRIQIKRGNITINQVIIIAVALAVFGTAAYGVGEKFGGEGGFNDLAKLLPGFNQTKGTISQIQIVGISINHPSSLVSNFDVSIQAASELQYYTGGSWVPFEKDKKVKINGGEFEPDGIKFALVDFYYRTERKGSGVFDYSDKINLKVQTWQNPSNPKSVFQPDGKMLLYGEFKPGKLGENDELGQSIEVTFKNDFSGQGAGSLTGEQKKSIINYRDQILKGKACEKFLEIGGNKYAVRRGVALGEVYLFVDLGDPALGEEAYAKCTDKTDTSEEFVNVAQLGISFEAREGVTGLYWGDKPGNKKGCLTGWYVLTESGDYLPASGFSAGEFKLSSIEQSDFISGLSAIVMRLDRSGMNDYGAVVVYALNEDGSAGRPVYSPEDGQVDYSPEKTAMKDAMIEAYNSGVRKSSETRLNEIAPKNPHSQPSVYISAKSKREFKWYDSQALPSFEDVSDSSVASWENRDGKWGWYLNGEAIKLDKSVTLSSIVREQADFYMISSNEFPYIIFATQNYQNSFSSGLGFVIAGFDTYGEVGTLKSKGFASYHNLLNVRVVGEGQERDISSSVNYYRNKYDKTTGISSGGSLDESGAKERGEMPEVKKASNLIRDYYQSVFDEAYC